MTQFTREEMPEVSEGESVTVTIDGKDLTGEVENVRENGHSIAYSLTIDGTSCKMYADARCVELIIDNTSHFVTDFSTE